MGERVGAKKGNTFRMKMENSELHLQHAVTALSGSHFGGLAVGWAGAAADMLALQALVCS